MNIYININIYIYVYIILYFYTNLWINITFIPFIINYDEDLQILKLLPLIIFIMMYKYQLLTNIILN